MNLLIGGTNDGERVEFADDAYIYRALKKVRGVAVDETTPKTGEEIPCEELPPSEVELYRAIAVKTRLFRVWVLEGMSEQEAMLRLLEHYHP